MLLDIASLSLEARVQRLSIDKHITGDDTHGRPLSQTIKQSGLTSSADTHQSRQGAGLDPSGNTIEKSAGASLDGDIVYDIAPGENVLLGLNSIYLLVLSIVGARSGAGAGAGAILCHVLTHDPG